MNVHGRSKFKIITLAPFQPRGKYGTLAAEGFFERLPSFNAVLGVK